MDTDDFVLRLIPTCARSGTVLIGGFITMLSFCVIYTFGNLLPYMTSYWRWKIDPTMTFGKFIWVQTFSGSAPLGLQIGSYLERRFGGRLTAFVGSFIYTSAIAVTYVAIQQSFPLLLLTLGLISGIGGSIAYHAILTTTQRWFPDNIGLAGSMIVAGYGCGAFILSPLQTAFLNPLNYKVNSEGFFTQVDLLQKVPQVFIVMASLFALLQIVGLLFVGQPLEEPEVETVVLSMESSRKSAAEELKSPLFFILFVSLTCSAIWVQLISGLYKVYGQLFIYNDLFLSFVGSLASIFNVLSRVIWGIIVQRTSYQFSMAILCTIGASLVWLLPIVQVTNSHIAFLTLICGIFSCVGGIYSLFPYITHKCFGNTNFSVIYGFLQGALSLAGVWAAILSQFVLPVVGLNMLFVIMGCFMSCSLLLTLFLHHAVSFPPKMAHHSHFSYVEEQ